MAFKLANLTIPVTSTGGGNPSSNVANAVAYYTIIDDNGSLTVDQLTLTGNSSALMRYIPDASSPSTFVAAPVGALYNGQYNGYHFGGTTSILGAAGTVINKFPFSSSTQAVNFVVPGVLAIGRVQVGKGTAKSSTKAYLMGGAPDGQVAAVTAMQVFPFAVGDSHGTYTAPAVLPVARKETQFISNIDGGFVYATGGGGPGVPNIYYAFSPTIPAATTTFKMPVASDAGPVSSTGTLVTGRAQATAYSAPDKGMVAGGQQFLAAAMVSSIETFPWASEVWSQTFASLINYKMAAGFQSVSVGYQGYGANNAPTYAQPSGTGATPSGYLYKTLAVVSFPFASVGSTVTEYFTPQIHPDALITNKQGISGLYEGFIVSGWPGGGPPSGSAASAFKYPFAGKVAILTPSVDSVDGHTTQD